MRQRITFLHKPQDGVDPATFKLTDTSLHGPVLPAVREDRITLALDELPDELRQFLETCHELHIRWVSPYPYETVSPLLSRLSPGFHLFYTPAGSHSLPEDQLCAALKKAFGPLDCKTAASSLTTLPNDRFSHSAAYQYYQPLDSLTHLITYAHTTLCPPASPTDPPDSSCASRVARLASASTLDLSYDTISHALQITATWSHSDQPLAVVAPPNAPDHRIEVGILTAGADAYPTLEPHEIGMAGALTVLGPGAKPASTMFSFPARHRAVDNGAAAFTASFATPTGLHPSLRLALNAAALVPPPPAREEDGQGQETCALHAYLTLPRAVFADRYQLADPLFLASKNVSALRYMSSPVDLEAPAYVMDVWGSAVLLELSPPTLPAKQSSAPSKDKWTPAAEIPLHLRYLPPAPGGYSTVEVPHPAVFWACTTDEGTKFPASPFERVNLGYDGLFGPRTVFWHIEPSVGAAGGDGRLVSSVRVPVLDSNSGSSWVSAGTAAVVVLGFGWIVWRLLRVYLATGYGPSKQMEGLEKKTQ